MIDYSKIDSSKWPLKAGVDKDGFEIVCIVKPNNIHTSYDALRSAHIPYELSASKVTSINGIKSDPKPNNTIAKWAYATAEGGTLAWNKETDETTIPTPQVDGFESWKALMCDCCDDTSPKVPQFAQPGGGGDDGSDGSLNPGAPNQTYSPASGSKGGTEGSGKQQLGDGSSRAGVGSQQGTKATAKAEATPSATPSNSTSPTPTVSASPSISVSPVYAAEKSRGGADLAARRTASKNWMWAGIGLAVVVAAGITTAITIINRKKKATPQTPPSGRR